MDLLKLELIDECEPVQEKEKPKRLPRSESFMMSLLTKVEGHENLLYLEEGSEERLDLDDCVRWRQKKVKEKALQLYDLILGKKIEAKVIRRSIEFLRSNGQISVPLLVADLVSGGYSVKTAQAQASQMVCLFKLLKVVNTDNQRNYFINSKSLIYKQACAHA